MNGYVNLHCKCEDCTVAWRLYQQRKRWSRRTRTLDGRGPAALCAVGSCQRPAMDRGLCFACRQRWRSKGGEYEDFIRIHHPMQRKTPKRMIVYPPMNGKGMDVPHPLEGLE